MILIHINKSGEIPNIGDLSKIKLKYLPIISQVRGIFARVLGNNLVSVYIRGSVSAGRDTRFSDLDCVAVTKKRINKKQEKHLSNYAVMLQSKYRFINGFELATVSLSQLLNSDEYFNLRVNLKTCSVLVDGKDIRNSIQRVIPNKRLSLKMYNYAHNEYTELKKYFSSAGEKKYLGEIRPVTFWCGWISRVLSRSGMGILVLNRKAYTNDIQFISNKMARMYPELRTFFQQTTEWVVNPTSNRNKVNKFLNKHVDLYFNLWNQLLHSKF